jgi:hypothetical protein
MALHLLLLSNKDITAPALLIRFNKGTVMLPLLLRRTSIKVVGMDNRRMDSLNRVRTVSRRLEGMDSLLPSLLSNTVSLLPVRTDSLRSHRTVNPRVRRLTDKVLDNLPLLLMVKDNLLLPLTDRLNLQLLLTEHL